MSRFSSVNSGSSATAVTRGCPNAVKDGSGLAKSTDWNTDAVGEVDESKEAVTEGVADVDGDGVVPELIVGPCGDREGSGVMSNLEIDGDVDGATVIDSFGSSRSGDSSTIPLVLPNDGLGEPVGETVVDTVGVGTGTSQRESKIVSSMEEKPANDQMGVYAVGTDATSCNFSASTPEVSPIVMM